MRFRRARARCSRVHAHIRPPLARTSVGTDASPSRSLTLPIAPAARPICSHARRGTQASLALPRSSMAFATPLFGALRLDGRTRLNLSPKRLGCLCGCVLLCLRPCAPEKETSTPCTGSSHACAGRAPPLPSLHWLPRRCCGQTLTLRGRMTGALSQCACQEEQARILCGAKATTNPAAVGCMRSRARDELAPPRF